MVMVDDMGQHSMEPADRSKTESIIIMSIVVSDPPEAGGVKPAPKTGKETPRRTSGTVCWRQRSSVRKKQHQSCCGELRVCNA